MGCIAIKQQCVPHTNINTPAMIPTYGRVLSTIEKALQKLVEEYQEVGKSLQDLVEGQERNMAQLERIGAMMEQRWSSEGENGKEKSRDEEGGLRMAPEKVRRRELHHLPSVSIVVLFSLFLIVIFFYDLNM